ncbi:MAG: hypothetical protein H6934_12535 [Burkholderiaceae bacterium]|nr:hypothetical protein [Burkholderiaceae bacterium]
MTIKARISGIAIGIAMAGGFGVGPAWAANGPSTCEAYARGAISQIAEAAKLHCAFVGEQWTPNLLHHIAQCRARKLAGVEKERKWRESRLAECRGFCRKYAKDAVRAAGAARTKQCGLGGKRWTADEIAHYDWCRSVSQETARAERRIRERDLRTCDRHRQWCDHFYAKRAIAQAGQNRAKHCGYAGSRWSGDAGLHRRWCITVARSVAQAETDQRTRMLEQCAKGAIRLPSAK